MSTKPATRISRRSSAFEIAPAHRGAVARIAIARMKGDEGPGFAGRREFPA